MKALIITNNPKVNIEFKDKENIEFYEDVSQEQILKIARDYIHLGAKLIMHPMMGRIKPHETPYKSVFLEKTEGKTDMDSIIIIEESIAETKKLIEHTYQTKYDEQLLPDLQYIDFLLLKSGVEEYRR
ncbi:MAG: GrdX protein [Firmicutes bacterium]|jgi:hypothetical protein|nr:GrdX protein [Bacillota bacterium]